MVSDRERLDLVIGELVNTMRDLRDKAADTVWISECETAFERLTYIFETAGGDRAELVAEFPEYFG